MIFVPVIWACFDFRSCKKKCLNYIPAKFYLFEKGPWPHFFMIWHGFGQVTGHVIKNIF